MDLARRISLGVTVLLVAGLIGCAAQQPSGGVTMAPQAKKKKDAAAPQAGPKNAGIGVVLQAQGRAFAITNVLADGPAAMAGASVGDVIYAVDGRSVEGLPLADLVERLRGAEGTPVRVAIRRGGAPYELAMTRAIIRVPPPAETPAPASNAPPPAPNAPPPAPNAPPPSSDDR